MAATGSAVLGGELAFALSGFTPLLGNKFDILTAASITGVTIAVDGGQHLAWRTTDATDVEE